MAFYSPPTQPECIKNKRKPKHLLQYKGPAKITRVRTPTTYDLTFEGRNYSRATAELRPYRATKEQGVKAPEIRDTEAFKVGDFVAYLEEKGDKHFHVGKIKSKGDNIIIDAYATPTRRINLAVWLPLEQIVATEQYTVQTSTRRHQIQVQDTFPADTAHEHVLSPKVELLPSGKLSSKSRKALKAADKEHHRLGTTFP